MVCSTLIINKLKRSLSSIAYLYCILLLTLGCNSFPIITNSHLYSSLHTSIPTSITSSTNTRKSSSSSSSSSRTTSLYSSSTSGLSQHNQKQNIFQNGYYNKPIVLVGCRGAGDELNRLASSIITMSDNINNLDNDYEASASTTTTTAQMVLSDLQRQDGSTKSRIQKKSSILPMVGTDSRGTWVVSHDEIQNLISNDIIDQSNVIVLDYDDPSFNVDNMKNSKKIENHYNKLLQQFYENDNMLIIYVNVHEESSGMSSLAKERKQKLEENVFIKFSDYELCIKDEGLDVSTVIMRELLLNAKNDNSEKETSTTDDTDTFESIVKSSDKYTKTLTIDSPEKKELLDSISQKQIQAWSNIEWQLKRILARASLPLASPGSKNDPNINTAHLTMGQNAFFLSLSFPEISQAEPYVEAMCQDVDAMEYRVDLLSCVNDRFELLYSLQKLRDMCRPHASRAPMLPFLGSVIDDCLPIVYTVRTINQAGKFPDDEANISKMFDLLQLGLRGAVEVLDIESAWDKNRSNHLLSLVESRYASQVLGSHHVVGKAISTDEAVRLFRQCTFGGRAHGSKVVLSIDDKSMDDQAEVAGKIAQNMAKEAGEPIIPHIGLILGEKGQYSRVLNMAFTPVTHESLPFIAAPGQLTASQLMATRLILGLTPPKKYGILGHNISYSVSPAMQSAAFAATRLPHSYALVDMENVEEFVNSDFWNDEAFGGCSVTIPHKQNIIPHLDILTEAAKSIGAVNTVIVNYPESEHRDSKDIEKRVLIGDNTDWKGIFNPLSRKLGKSPIPKTNDDVSNDPKHGDEQKKTEVALILGGGGTARAAAYAATKLGLEKIYYNRTPSKVQELAEQFGGKVVTSLEGGKIIDPIAEKFNFEVKSSKEKVTDNSSESLSLGDLLEEMNGEVRVIISTLPASAEFELPSWFVQNVKNGNGKVPKPIIFDVNYKPYWTNLLRQADRFSFPIVRGSEMLWEQGVGQFELWTGRTAPYKVMKGVVLKNCLPPKEEEE